MKLKKHFTILSLVACIVFAACKKENKTTAEKVDFTLTRNDTNKTVTVAKDQTIALVLDNPGGGGYQFNAVQFDSTVLNLKSHIRESRPNPKTGDAGYDTWTFKALVAGLTPIRITASRGSKDTIELFKGEIKVK